MAKEQAQEQEQAQESKVKYVQMVRDEQFYPAPHTAQVHPDEVVNYQLGGWVTKADE